MLTALFCYLFGRAGGERHLLRGLRARKAPVPDPDALMSASESRDYKMTRAIPGPSAARPSVERYFDTYPVNLGFLQYAQSAANQLFAEHQLLRWLKDDDRNA